jgi:hypothetical protein
MVASNQFGINFIRQVITPQTASFLAQGLLVFQAVGRAGAKRRIETP